MATHQSSEVLAGSISWRTVCPWLKTWSLFPVVITLLCCGQAAAVPEETDSQQYAVLIGIEKYHRASQLQFTINDVKKLSQTLQDRGAVPRANIREIVDTAPLVQFQPLRSSLLTELPKLLAKPGPRDQILVYFSGHGFRDKQGRLYLAPIDCDPSNPEATGIAAEWLREQLAACKADFKLLVLDACHAGTEKAGDQPTTVPASEIGEMFRDTLGVVTLASSTSDEKSQIWAEKQQSLFTYWLNLGLKGHADTDGDSAVSIDELYDYVHRNVSHSAKVLFSRPQTPVRVVRSGTVGVPKVIHLQPQPLNLVINDIAEQLAWAMQERKLSKLGVLEFTNDTKLGELLGADFGLLGRTCASNLERQLMNLAAGKFSVVNRRRLQLALQSGEFSLDDLGSSAALKQLGESAGGMPVVALGTLRNRSGRTVHLHCGLLQTEGVELAGSAGGTALLSESEWAMIGRSVQVKPEDRRPPLSRSPEAKTPQADRVIEQLDKRAEGAHPLLDPKFPYRVKIMVGRKERKPVFRDNECFVPLSKGEVYEIRVENNSGRVALMRLLVDGLNTLPQREVVKDLSTYLIAAPVSLDEARFWIMDPEFSRVNGIRGFVTETGTEGKLREFTVVDASESLAARQQFTAQLGMITAAFYAPGGGSRGIGTAAGKERIENLEVRGGYTVGNLLGVVHIRYVEPEALGETPQVSEPEKEKPDAGARYVVTIRESTMKVGPRVITRVPKGNELLIEKSNADWIWVEYMTHEGWIPRRDVLSVEDGIVHFTAAIRTNPRDAEAYLIRGDLWDDQHRDKALADFNESIRLRPGSPEAFFYRGRHFISRSLDEGRSTAEDFASKAMRDLNESIRLYAKSGTQSDDEYEAQVFRERGFHWPSVKQYDKAITDFTHAIRLNPNEVKAYCGRALVYDELGKDSLAEADFRKAEEIDFGIVDELFWFLEWDVPWW